MAIITDPDDLADTTDIDVNTANKTIEIKTTGAVTSAGALGGVAGQALYSWLKEEWKTNSEYIRFPFPMEAITPEQFEFINGWLPLDDTTRKLIRTAGWAERTLAGAVERQYTGIVSLGTLDIADQPYSRFGALEEVDFDFPGEINEALQIFGDAGNGDFDYTNTALTLFCREQGKTYATSNNTAIGATTLTYITYRFPLTNATDLNITVSDAIIQTGVIYTGIDIEYFYVDQLFDVDDEGIDEAYRYIVTDPLTTATTQEIYEKVQWSLRYTGNINVGTGAPETGRVANVLANFVGSTLVGEDGVYFSGLNSNYLNSVDFYDFTGIVRRYPFVSAGNINFGAFAGSGDFRWWAFYDSVPSGDYGTTTGVIVQDSNSVELSGLYVGSSVSFDFSYDSNSQGGRTPATDAGVTLVGIGLTGGQFASVGFTITRSQGIAVLLAPAQERNYTNP
tara:strand:+ start:138302 stop:139654 length:1353 start_codon:yes stop_codon:yes gene_type:complete